MLMLVLLVALPSCATTDSSASKVGAAKPPPSVRVVLTNREGNVRLTFPAPEVGPLQLQAFGEQLLGASGPRPELWINGKAVSMEGANPIRMDPPISGSEWRYADGAGSVTNVPDLKSFQRRFLCIEPDLVVVLDEISLTEPALLETGYWFPSGVSHDPVRDEWTVQAPKGGMTARFLSSPKSNQTRREAIERQAVGTITNSALSCVRSVVADKIREFYQITVLVFHPEQSRRSLAFKLLESDTAIGVRVHRDGLPTLAAFRKTSCTGEANLTGMKFDGPVGVDVFRPKKR